MLVLPPSASSFSSSSFFSLLTPPLLLLDVHQTPETNTLPYYINNANDFSPDSVAPPASSAFQQPQQPQVTSDDSEDDDDFEVVLDQAGVQPSVLSPTLSTMASTAVKEEEELVEVDASVSARFFLLFSSERPLDSL